MKQEKEEKDKLRKCLELKEKEQNGSHSMYKGEFDEKHKELIDLNNEDIHPIKIKKTIPGKKIKSVDRLVRVDADN